jgi:metallo-beta-lactamase family protein
VYRSHPNGLDPSVAEAVREGHGILGGDGVTYIRSFEASTELTTKPGPHIVIASSGMCDAGRIVSHLKQVVDDPRCSVILVSYQASGTTGRRLTENKPTIFFQGKEWNKWINVVHLEGFSGHADKNDFLAYLSPLVGQVKKIRLIHGEREQADALAETLRGVGFTDVAVPEPGDREAVG